MLQIYVNKPIAFKFEMFSHVFFYGFGAAIVLSKYRPYKTNVRALN